MNVKSPVNDTNDHILADKQALRFLQISEVICVMWIIHALKFHCNILFAI